MNDKIKELAENTGIGWDDKYHWYISASQMEQLVQDIVNQCGFELVHESLQHNSLPIQVFTAKVADRIRHRFGLK